MNHTDADFVTDETRRSLLLVRLADLPVEHWRLDEEAAVTIMNALAAPASVPEEVIAEMNQIVEHMKQGSALVESQYRRLRRTHRVTLGLNLAVSAMFLGSYLNSDRLVELFCSVLWLVGPLAYHFFPRRGTL